MLSISKSDLILVKIPLILVKIPFYCDNTPIGRISEKFGKMFGSSKTIHYLCKQ